MSDDEPERGGRVSLLVNYAELIKGGPWPSLETLEAWKAIFINDLKHAHFEHSFGKIKDDEANKLGISWLWALPETHPLTPAGWVHDQLYKSDVSKNMSRREADLVFLKICNAHAGNRLPPIMKLACPALVK